MEKIQTSNWNILLKAKELHFFPIPIVWTSDTNTKRKSCFVKYNERKGSQICFACDPEPAIVLVQSNTYTRIERINQYPLYKVKLFKSEVKIAWMVVDCTTESLTTD